MTGEVSIAADVVILGDSVILEDAVVELEGDIVGEGLVAVVEVTIGDEVVEDGSVEAGDSDEGVVV